MFTLTYLILAVPVSLMLAYGAAMSDFYFTKWFGQRAATAIMIVLGTAIVCGLIMLGQG